MTREIVANKTYFVLDEENKQYPVRTLQKIDSMSWLCKNLRLNKHERITEFMFIAELTSEMGG